MDKKKIAKELLVVAKGLTSSWTEYPNHELRDTDDNKLGVFSLEDIYDDDVTLGEAFLKISKGGNSEIDYNKTLLGRYVRHSDNPNLKVIELLDHISGKMYAYATRADVEVGDEFTVDFNTFPWEVGN